MLLVRVLSLVISVVSTCPVLSLVNSVGATVILIGEYCWGYCYSHWLIVLGLLLFSLVNSVGVTVIVIG